MCCPQDFSKLKAVIESQFKPNLDERQAKLNQAKELLERHQELSERYTSAAPKNRKVLRTLANACLEQAEALLNEAKN